MSLIEIDETAIDELKESIKKQLLLLCVGCREQCKAEMQTSVDAEFQRFLSRLECVGEP